MWVAVISSFQVPKNKHKISCLVQGNSSKVNRRRRELGDEYHYELGRHHCKISVLLRDTILPQAGDITKKSFRSLFYFANCFGPRAAIFEFMVKKPKGGPIFGQF